MRFSLRVVSTYAATASNTTMLCFSTMSMTLHSMLARHSWIKGGLTTFPCTGVSLNLANLSVSFPEQVPIPTTLSSMSTVGMAMTHSLFFRNAAKEWFHSPVVMANTGVKSITMVQEIVMMLSLCPSCVVTRTTGPDSIRVKVLFSSNSCMRAPLDIPLTDGQAKLARFMSLRRRTQYRETCFRRPKMVFVTTELELKSP